MAATEDRLKHAQQLLVEGLKNAHALEAQAHSVMHRQIEQLDEYPALRERLATHVAETDVQLERLEVALRRYDATPSTLKDAGMQLLGSSQAMVQLVGPGKFLRAVIADQGVEGFEIASYVALIALAGEVGDMETAEAMRLSLAEERAMFSWLADHIPAVTAHVLDRSVAA